MLSTRARRRDGRSRSRLGGASCQPLESRHLLSAAVPVVIDLLAVYTPAAATQVGGDAHMVSLIQGSVDSMNQAMINSGISISVRLVHAETISYSSSGDVYTDRVRLETNGDGYMDSVFALRNAWHADLVTLISDGVGGGNGDLMTGISDPNNPNLAFSAVFASGIGPGFLTIAHELGHNLGAGHERNNPTEDVVGPFPYSYGYRFSVASPTLNASYNDIMSYGYGNDIPLIQYANPSVTFAGVPTGKPAGDPNSADLASTFLQTAPIVANYRTPSLADTVAPTGSLFEVDRVGSSLTFTVRYGDDSGIDLSTIGASDITVSGPGGFVLPATFVSMDQPTVAGAYKFATYHVTLPATNPATSALSFNLLPNAIADIYGRPAVAGALPPYSGYYAGSPFEASGTYAAYAWAKPLSATLAPGAAFTEYGSLGPDDYGHYYAFTLAQAATVAITLGGFTADCNFYLTSDANHDGLDDDANLTPDNGYNAGLSPDDVGLTLAAGTYYVRVYQPTAVQTGYTLTIRADAAGVDTVAPTAVADTRDVKTAGAPYVDFAVTYSDDFDFNGVSGRFDAAVDIHSTTYGYSYYLYPDPDLNPYYYADAQSQTIYYRVYAGTNGFTAADNDTFTLSVHDSGSNPGPRDAAGNKLGLISLGSFSIAIGTADTAKPTAALAATAPTPGQTTWTFSVTYKDNLALDTSSFDGSDLRVTGPNSYNQPATFLSATPSTNIGGSYVATYSVPAPGGYWDATDAGSYAVALQASQVRDASGNFAGAATFPAVAFASPHLAAQASPAAVGFLGTSGDDTMRVDEDASFVYLNLDDALLYLVPVSLAPRLALLPQAGNDSLYFRSAALGATSATISPAAGADTLFITGGVLSLDSDITASASLAVSLTATGSLTLGSTQHFSALSLAGASRVSLTTGASKVLVTKALALASTATLNLADDAMIIDYTGTSPANSVRSLLQSAYASNTWTGTGLTSGSAAADGAGLHAIGYGEASDLLGIKGPATSAWQGQTVDATSLLVRYVKTGDTDLSGTVDGSDLANLFAGQAGQLAGWTNGDLNYDGSVTSADRTLLLAALQSPVGAPPPSPGAMAAVPPHLAVTNASVPPIVAGQRIAPIQVELLDASGALATTARSRVTASLFASPGSATLLGTVTVALRRGVATFSGLSVRIAGTYALEFDADGASAAFSPGISVAPAAASRALLSLPASPVVATPFSITVTVTDRFGNVVTGDSDPVRLDLRSGAAHRDAFAATSSLADGIAVFANVTVNSAGSYLASVKVDRYVASRKFVVK